MLRYREPLRNNNQSLQDDVLGTQNERPRALDNMVVSPDGEWVRYEDVFATLKAFVRSKYPSLSGQNVDFDKIVHRILGDSDG